MTIRAPPRKEKERQAMRAVFSNLEDAYEAGYADGMAEIRKRYRRRQERKARRWYFIKQKLYGVALLIARRIYHYRSKGRQGKYGRLGETEKRRRLDKS